MSQIANTVLLVSPLTFGFNEETKESNTFQHHLQDSSKVIQIKAEQEWNSVCKMLITKGVNVIAILDSQNPVKPDALFPNNWITTHEDGKIIIYPLLAKNRRTEKRLEIINALQQKYVTTDFINLSFFEKEDTFLEGTGSMVFDRDNKIIYSCLSARTHIEPLKYVGKLLGYEVVSFHAFNHNHPIYHTNVFMSVGSKWVAICFDAIPDRFEKEKLKKSFKNTGKEIIELSIKQIDLFAGNILELKSKTNEAIIVMSQTTLESLSKCQKKQFSSHGEICAAAVPTIEQVGGGGIRCLLAEIFLK